MRVARQFGKMAAEPGSTFGDGAGYFLLRATNPYIFEETSGHFFFGKLLGQFQAMIATTKLDIFKKRSGRFRCVFDKMSGHF